MVNVPRPSGSSTQPDTMVLLEAAIAVRKRGKQRSAARVYQDAISRPDWPRRSWKALRLKKNPKRTCRFTKGEPKVYNNNNQKDKRKWSDALLYQPITIISSDRRLKSRPQAPRSERGYAHHHFPDMVH